MRLDQRLALIIGKAQGLGKKFALTLLNRGANVVIVDSNQELGYGFERRICHRYGEKRIKFIQCDVSDSSELRKTFDYSRKLFGRLDIVCNNSSDTLSDDWLPGKKVAFNLTACIESTYNSIDIMGLHNGGNGGVVINIASGIGYENYADSAIYTATKFGVIGFSRSFKYVCSKNHGVRVNCISPFFSPTRTFREGIIDKSKVEYQLGHFGYTNMDDFRKAFLMCIEDDSLNGEIIVAHETPCIVTLIT